jgi:hypothetical protein
MSLCPKESRGSDLFQRGTEEGRGKSPRRSRLAAKIGEPGGGGHEGRCAAGIRHDEGSLDVGAGSHPCKRLPQKRVTWVSQLSFVPESTTGVPPIRSISMQMVSPRKPVLMAGSKSRFSFSQAQRDLHSTGLEALSGAGSLTRISFKNGFRDRAGKEESMLTREWPPFALKGRAASSSRSGDQDKARGAIPTSLHLF